MSYAVDLAPELIEALRALPVDAAEYVLDAIDRLAESPTTLSRSGGTPFYLFQVYEFTNPHYAGRRSVVAFQYSQDEQTLHILAMHVFDE